MKTALLFLAVIAAFAIAVTLKRRRRPLESEKDMPSFLAKRPLTEPEQVLYFRLVEALPEFIVLAQVQMTALMTIKGRGQQTWFNKISSKSVDYAICTRDFAVMAVIELDDKTHESEERRQKDADKDRALDAAGVRLLRLKGMNLPSKEALALMIQRIPQSS